MSIIRLTTGVLNKNVETQLAHIEAVNLSDEAQTVHVKTVSYTHLDVYKRQPQDRM